MSSTMRRVFANPSVTPLLVFCLVVAGLFGWFHAGKDLWGDWQREREIDRASHWSPEPWGLTADEFPGHDAAELPVDTAGMTTERQPGWSVSAVTHDALGPLFSGRIGYLEFGITSDGVDDEVDAYPTDATSGVVVDGVQVVTFVTVSPHGAYVPGDRAYSVWQLRWEAEIAAESELRDHSPVWNADGAILSAGYVGRRLTEAEFGDLQGRGAGLDTLGPFGIATHQRGEDGKEFRTTTLATVVEGALVSVGVVVPDGVEPAADLEPALLLERLSDEVRADPPSHESPDSTALAG